MMKKKILSLVVVMAMLLSFMPVIAQAETSGECGENLTWTLDDNGTLIISGTGDMTDWSSPSSVPWYSSRSSIKNVIIGNSITSIGGEAFYNCSSLESVTIGNSVTSIGRSAFDSCSSLTSISVDMNNKYYSSENGNLFDKDKTTLIQYAIGKTDTQYTIPDSVTSIGSDAFYWCSSLESVVIPDSVTSIGDYAFYNCSSLESIVIPDSVTSIGDLAFRDCNSLESVIIPASVESIGENAFCSCDSLTSVIIGDSVTSIGYGAFASCSGLKSVKIGNRLESIGDFAFCGCGRLTSVTIPNGVEFISDYAFSDCGSLKSVTIPDSVTGIAWFAFSDCSSLTDVYYGGSENEWKAISIDAGNTPLTKATIHYNSTGIPSSLDYCQTQILDYSEIDGKYVINSIASNNTDTAISCVMYSAVYSSDGTLKACGTVKADIGAGNDKEVDITVPCTIETGDTIKTFMWADNMTPFAKAGKLVIE